MACVFQALCAPGVLTEAGLEPSDRQGDDNIVELHESGDTAAPGVAQIAPCRSRICWSESL